MRRSAVRKYALIVIASAVVPMVLVGVLYDRYARSLLVEFTGERVDARLVATASRIGAFLEARTNQLGKLARHPSAWALRLEDPGHSGEMVDLVRLEADHPDLYGILVFSPDGALAEAYMGQAASGPPYLGGPFATDGLARARLGDAEVVGPVPPAEGRSGWFLIRQPLEGGGTIALHVRLASLTELIGPATEADVLTPVLRTPAGDFDGVGRPATIQGGLVLGPEVLPGWRPGLVVKPDEIVRPFQDARVALLVATLVAGGTIALLLFRMAWRLKQRVDVLAEGTELVAAGRFAHRVEVGGDDEIALLARRFNRMAGRLGRLVERTVRMKRQAALGQFSTGVAHEVRNPLAALKTAVQAMARLEREPERAALLADMEREIDRMSRAMAAILTFGRPRPPERTAVSLDEEAHSVLALVAPDARRREVELVRGELPGGAALVDPDHLRQILLNLFANALHATPAGGRVTLRGRAREAAVELEVEDTGEGIPEDRLAQVFEPFFTTKRAGTGLGLSISRQLAEMNGGALVLRSVVGAGTRAVLSLPREGPHVDDPDHR
jgi:two-component system sensor histidine kinase AtoS